MNILTLNWKINMEESTCDYLKPQLVNKELGLVYQAHGACLRPEGAFFNLHT